MYRAGDGETWGRGEREMESWFRAGDVLVASRMRSILEKAGDWETWGRGERES